MVETFCAHHQDGPYTPLAVKDNNGHLVHQLSCDDCLKSSPYYCEKHKELHHIFADGAACQQCIDEQTYAIATDELFAICEQLMALPENQFEDFQESAIDNMKSHDTIERSMYRLIYSKAVRTNNTVQQVIERLLSDHHIGYLFVQDWKKQG